MNRPHSAPRCSQSLSLKLECHLGTYFVSGEGNPDETIYTIYHDPTIERDACVRRIPENIVAYVTSDHQYAFVLERLLDQFIADTLEYGICYIPVSDFDRTEFRIDCGSEIPALLRKITWIDDSFLEDETIEFDFEAFYRIDSGIRYLNPSRFSVHALISFLKWLEAL